MNRDVLLKILDLARWAPSGDNTQPWRFEIVSDHHIAIHGHDTREHVLYDFDGHASQMAHGALLQTIELAASRFGLHSEWLLRPGTPEALPIYDVRLEPARIDESPLTAFIETRCVQRRPMRTTPLNAQQKKAFVDAVGKNCKLQFFESFEERMAVARLLWKNAYLRLTCPEAYPTHRDIIEWDTRFSKYRIPAQAIGVDPLTAKLMRWVMQSWERVDFFNRYLMGTFTPRVQLDFLPAIRCASHILMRPNEALRTPNDYVCAGMAVQRLWLTATSLGLHLQPEMTPVIFRWYVQSNRSISSLPSIDRGAENLANEFNQLARSELPDDFSFFCRVGHSRLPTARSVRMDLSDLMKALPSP